MSMIWSGTNIEEEAISIKEEIIQLLQERGFKLRKWASNTSSLQDKQSMVEQREFILASHKESEKRILGIIWNCQSDTFKITSITYLSSLERPIKEIFYHTYCFNFRSRINRFNHSKN